MGDVHILTGLHGIVNLDNIDPKVNIQEIEQLMINGGVLKKTQNTQDKFNDEINKMAARAGIDLGEFKSVTEQEYDEDDEGEDQQPVPSYSAPARSNMTPYGGATASQEVRREDPYPAPRTTNEEERRHQINSVNEEMGATSIISLENEKKEDSKSHMLEEIDSLIYSLQEEEIDLSRIPAVDRSSSYEMIDSVLKTLRHKNDRLRYCNFAEEFLLLGAYSLEDLFDGQRTWFGRYRPSLKGWHQQVNVKLRRMRHDTSQLVSGIMQDYNIGPAARLLLELVPNMFLHSKMCKDQSDAPALYSDAEMASASQRIRDSFEKNKDF